MKVNRVLGVAMGIAAAGYGVYRIVTKMPRRYSNKWFDRVSDGVLHEARKIARRKYCSVGNNFDLALEAERLLRRFDAVLENRAWNGKKYACSVHSEDDWYLPNDN